MVKSRYWQAVRGICILAVIMIHCPVGQNGLDQIVWLALRQFINFPVAIFIFMAGYFIKPEKVNADYIINRGGAAVVALPAEGSNLYCKKSVFLRQCSLEKRSVRLFNRTRCCTIVLYSGFISADIINSFYS